MVDLKATISLGHESSMTSPFVVQTWESHGGNRGKASWGMLGEPQVIIQNWTNHRKSNGLG